MEERAAAVFAAVAFPNKVNAGKSRLVRQVHDLLLVLSMANEVLAAAQLAFGWSAFAASVNGERRAIRLGVGHCNTWQVERQHGKWIGKAAILQPSNNHEAPKSFNSQSFSQTPQPYPGSFQRFPRGLQLNRKT